MTDDNEGIEGLIAIGIIALIGVGLYRVIKAVGSFDKGDEVTKEELATITKDAQLGEECESCGGDCKPEELWECSSCSVKICPEIGGSQCFRCYIDSITSD